MTLAGLTGCQARAHSAATHRAKLTRCPKPMRTPRKDIPQPDNRTTPATDSAAATAPVPSSIVVRPWRASGDVHLRALHVLGSETKSNVELARDGQSIELSVLVGAVMVTP